MERSLVCLHGKRVCNVLDSDKCTVKFFTTLWSCGRARI